MKIFKNIIILTILLLLSFNIVSYANTNNIKEYKITKEEENYFLENIYNTETESSKIKSIDKDILDENYTTKESTETKVLNKQNENYIYEQFGNTKEFNDGEYKGTLSISDIKVENINNGYYEKIDEKIFSFANYTDNDLINIEKEINLNNTTYYLINVDWQPDKTENIDGNEIPITYKGNKIYQTIQKIANLDTYKITVTYSGQVEKINTIYNYKVTYENQVKEPEKVVEEKNNNVATIIIVSGIGLAILLITLVNVKNTYVYSKNSKGFTLIKKERLNDKNLSIDITYCKNLSRESIYAIKLNKFIFNKLKGRTISVVLGNKKKDIVLWNNYYEIKL